MARTAGSAIKRPRISIDVDPEFRRQVRMAAAQRELSVRRYVLEAVEARLWGDAAGGEGSRPLTAAEAPLLAKLWDNPFDARYDELYPR